MALFELNSDVTIGAFRFSGVHEAHIKRSLHSIVETAIIKIPAKGKIIQRGKEYPEEIITSEQFKDGDPVTIKLGYNGNLQTEFSGFVKRRNLNMPLEIECEGYCWLIKQNDIKVSEKTITIKDLLNRAVSEIRDGYNISVICIPDITLGNVQLSNKTGAEIIQFILDATDNSLSIFFSAPDVLYCGHIYTDWANGKESPGLGSADYALGYNMPKGNSLKKRSPENDNVSVMYSKKKSKGDKLQKTSNTYKNLTSTHSKILNYIQDEETLEALANEKAHQMNYTGYEGTITAFLQPFAMTGYKANLTDIRYKAQDGTYLIESTEVTFGVTGARRIIELGPKLGFAK